MKVFLFLFLWMNLTGFVAQNSDNEVISNDIETIFSTSDHISFGKIFASTVQLDLPKYTGQWSSSQSMYIVKEFFENYPVKSFEVIQFGTNRSKNTFLAGIYKTETTTFDVYIVFKEESSKLCVYKLNIREQ
ncbi:MAG: DUF4783 domain-containing protein [Bacteroidales bacterium]|nr:DUF4783 domain-containing protein [Bacteroidales bacterium]